MCMSDLWVLEPYLDRPLEDAGVGRVDPVKQHHVACLTRKKSKLLLLSDK